MPALVILLAILVLFGLGAALHALWWAAIIALAIWLAGFMSHPRGGRWYRW